MSPEPHANGVPSRGYQACPGCGSRFALKRATLASVLAPGGDLVKRAVCPECAARAVVLVAADQITSVRSVLHPFALHLRKLAKAYELAGDPRSVGLVQAADILEAGRAALPEPTLADATPPPDAPRLLHKSAQVPAPNQATARNERDSKRAFVPKVPHEDATTFGRLERELLRVLVQRAPRPTHRKQLALLSRYSVDSGSFSTGLGRLRAAGWMQGPAGALVITVAGVAAAGPVDPLPTGENLAEYWVKRVGPCAGSILEVAMTEYPSAVDRAELAARTGYSVQSGSFSTALGQLRTLGLLDGFRASDELMSAVQGET